MKKLLLVITILTICLSAHSKVNWELQVGGMYREVYRAEYIEHGDYSKGGRIEVLARLLLQIPVSKKVPFFIETGLGWHEKPVFAVAEGIKFPDDKDYISSRDIDEKNGDFLMLPLKCGYKLKLNEKNSINFAAGPYIAAPFETVEFNRGFIDFGLEASVEYRHRCMSFGVMWLNPIFINSQRNYYKNSINVTIGINFGFGKVNWEKVAAVMTAVSESTSTFVNNYNQYQQSVNGGSSYYESDSGSSYGDSYSGNSSKGGNDFSLSEQTAYNRDKRTYSNYESQLSKIIYGNSSASQSEIKNIRQKMKSLRLKWEKKGKSFPKSSLE